MRSSLCITLVLSAGLLAPQWAFADDQSAEIKAAIDAYLKDSAERIEDTDFTYKDLTVTAKGEVYEVVFTDLAAKVDDDVNIDAGSPSFTVQPQGDDWLVSNVSLPPKLTLTDVKGGESAEISWTLVGLTATWTPLLREFKQLDAKMTDVVVAVTEKGSAGGADETQTVDLGAIEMKIDTTETNANAWSHQSVLSMGPVKVTVPEDSGVLTIEKILVENGVDNLDPQAYLKQIETVAALEAAAEAKDAAKEKELEATLLAMAPVAEGINQSFTVTGFSFEDPSDGELNIKQKSASVSFDAVATKGSPTGSVTLKLKGQGTELSGKGLDGEDQLASMLTPENVDIELALDKLPVKEVNELIMQLAFSALDLTPEPNIAFPKIMAAASEAGSELVLKPITLQGKYASVDGEGQAKVDPQAAMQAVGGATLTLTGLEKLQEAVATLPKDMQQGVTGAMVFLKGLGKAETVDGAVAYKYVFDLPADGNVTLNGQPLGALMGGN
ncbi:MAG: hypothetical protein Kilf2KO_19690 [Rhodospirillales bacterium]